MLNFKISPTEIMLLLVAISNILGWLSVFYLGIEHILIVWLVLTFTVSTFGFRYQVLRSEIAWIVWIPLSLIGLGVNYATYSEGIFGSYGFVFVWALFIGIGYIFISIYNRKDGRLSKYNRIQFTAFGIISLALGLYLIAKTPSIQIRIAIGLIISVVPTVASVVIYRKSRMRN